jgi:hypothetical protein
MAGDTIRVQAKLSKSINRAYGLCDEEVLSTKDAQFFRLVEQLARPQVGSLANTEVAYTRLRVRLSSSGNLKWQAFTKKELLGGPQIESLGETFRPGAKPYISFETTDICPHLTNYLTKEAEDVAE